MKYPELSCDVYAEVDGENVLLIEIDREGRAKVYHENLRIDWVRKIFEEINCNIERKIKRPPFGERNSGNLQNIKINLRHRCGHGHTAFEYLREDCSGAFR